MKTEVKAEVKESKFVLGDLPLIGSYSSFSLNLNLFANKAAPKIVNTKSKIKQTKAREPISKMAFITVSNKFWRDSHVEANFSTRKTLKPRKTTNADRLESVYSESPISTKETMTKKASNKLKMLKQ